MVSTVLNKNARFRVSVIYRDQRYNSPWSRLGNISYLHQIHSSLRILLRFAYTKYCGYTSFIFQYFSQSKDYANLNNVLKKYSIHTWVMIQLLSKKTRTEICRPWLVTIKNTIWNSSCKYCHMIICIMQDIADSLHSFGALTPKLSLMCNGIQLAYISFSSDVR